MSKLRLFVDQVEDVDYINLFLTSIGYVAPRFVHMCCLTPEQTRVIRGRRCQSSLGRHTRRA